MRENELRGRPIPIGVRDFRELCDREYCYVDKTLFVKQVLDAGAKATLLTRPRRFGKTLNMSMLRTFFEKTDDDTSVYFRDKKIWSEGPKYTDEQGRYPVISVSFAFRDADTWKENYKKIQNTLTWEYRRHLKILKAADGAVLDELDEKHLRDFITGDPSIGIVEDSLRDLSRILHAAYGVKPIMLIDEYDTPVESAWTHGGNGKYYQKMIRFMRSLLGAALKENDDLAFACLTGVLRVAKENLFSGLNSLRVDGVLESHYDECFGFARDEVRSLTTGYGVAERLDEIDDWYDGYRFGNEEVFNPWSVLMYLANGCVAKEYWTSTSGNGELARLLRRADADALQGITSMLGNEPVASTISESLRYPDLDRRKGHDLSEAAYTLLLMSGYLTTDGQEPPPAGQARPGRTAWKLRIPNLEVEEVYRQEILLLLKKGSQSSACSELRDAVSAGDAEKMQASLAALLKRTVSYHDLGSEKPYHMWLLGLLASMPEYRIKSNRESGEGRYDISLTPEDVRMGHPGVLIEIKHAGKKMRTKSRLKVLAEDAVRQIRDRAYATDLEELGVERILELGVAFGGKKVCVVAGDQVP